MTDAAPSIDQLIAHRSPMRFLDRVLTVSETEVVAEAYVRQDNPFFDARLALPSYTGLEMMAQAIAAIDGEICRRKGQPPKIGFLLGCRRYVSRMAGFADGTRLIVSARMILANHEMFAFDCQIDDDRGTVATASINVYAPADALAFIKRASP